MSFHKIKPLQEKHPDLEARIVQLVNKHGQHPTAKTFGISVGTLNRWLKDNGYIRKTQYIRRESEADE